MAETSKPKREGKLDATPDSPAVRRGKSAITTPPRPAHRPSGYTEELANEICERIMKGRPLSKVCLDNDMPHRDTVHSWLVKYQDFSDKYVRACQIRREYRFETLEDTIDREDDVQRARLKVDVIKWQLSKEEPKKYGDKLDVTSDGKQLPTPILGTIQPEDKS